MAQGPVANGRHILKMPGGAGGKTSGCDQAARTRLLERPSSGRRGTRGLVDRVARRLLAAQGPVRQTLDLGFIPRTDTGTRDERAGSPRCAGRS